MQPHYAGWEPLIELPGELHRALAQGDFAALRARPPVSAEECFALTVAALAMDDKVAAEHAARDVLARRPEWDLAVSAETLLRGRSVASTGPALEDKFVGSLGTLPPHTNYWARLAHALGVLLIRTRRSGEAVDWLLRAQSVYAERNNAFGEAEVSERLGTAYAYLGRTDAAAHSFARSIALRLQLNDQGGLAETLNNLARLSRLIGRPMDAVRIHGTALSIARQEGRSTTEVAAQLGRAMAAAGDLGGARELLTSLLATVPVTDEKRLFYLHKDLAQLEISASRFNVAREHLELARALCNPADVYQVARLQLLEGQVGAFTSDQAAAISLRHAAEQFAALEIPDLELDARLALARVYLHVGDRASAGDQLLLAAKRCRAHGLTRRLGEVVEMAHSHALSASLIGEESMRPVSWTFAEAGDGYVVLEQLGAGAHGAVFRALDLQTGREVAMKRFRRDLHPARDRAQLDQVRLEFEAARRSNHPGLVQVHALGMDADQQHYMTMEYLSGGTLRRFMSPDSSIAQICAVLGQVCYALAALHAAGVVHRDLKPENVLLRRDGSPVLTDFSIALLSGRSADGLQSAGTEGYMAPEQLLGGEIDARADLFALGAIAHEWLSGERVRIRLEPGKGLRRLWPLRSGVRVECRADILAALPAVMASLLSADPDDRPADAARVADRLTAAAGGA